MSPRTAEVKRFPGYGVVYPDGITGLKVVKTYTEAPKRIFNPDGSVSYTTPPPVIHELFGGGFAYADGNPVISRNHLQNITDLKMKDRALMWFDRGGEISNEAKIGIPTRDPDAKQGPPETVFVLSNDLPDSVSVPNFGTSSEGKHPEIPEPTVPATSELLDAIRNLADVVKKQGEDVKTLMQAVHPRKNPGASERLKNRWKDPEYRAKMLKKIKEKQDGAAQTDQAV